MRLLAAAALLLTTSFVQAADSNTTAQAASVLPVDFSPPPVFKNVNLLRNVNLEKGYARNTINVVVENIDKKPQSKYYLPFANDVFGNVGGLEAWDKDAAKKQKFDVEVTQFRPQRLVLSPLGDFGQIH